MHLGLCSHSPSVRSTPPASPGRSQPASTATSARPRRTPRPPRTTSRATSADAAGCSRPRGTARCQVGERPGDPAFAGYGHAAPPLAAMRSNSRPLYIPTPRIAPDFLHRARADRLGVEPSGASRPVPRLATGLRTVALAILISIPAGMKESSHHVRRRSPRAAVSSHGLAPRRAPPSEVLSGGHAGAAGSGRPWARTRHARRHRVYSAASGRPAHDSHA